MKIVWIWNKALQKIHIQLIVSLINLIGLFLYSVSFTDAFILFVKYFNFSKQNRKKLQALLNSWIIKVPLHANFYIDIGFLNLATFAEDT